MANLTASQIAAQAAMQHRSEAQHIRKRSQTVPNPLNVEGGNGRRGSKGSPPPLQTQHPIPSNQYQNGLVGGHMAATTAANAAFPRSATPLSSSLAYEHTPEEGKQKGERSKMKLFSKPKHIGISRDKEGEKKDRPLPSPNKMGFQSPSGLSRMVNVSTTSLADSVSSSASSMYSLNNSSTSTMIPADRQPSNEKEKAHKHHFLSRQKLKLKDKDDHHNLPLSSASSNSKPLDPNAPQSLYSFTPSSPGPSSTSFAKSMSGLDLRHGGRALREKKKEEKASANANLEPPFREDPDRSEWPSASSIGASTTSFLGPSSLGSASGGIFAADAALRETLQGFGLNNMTPDDAWDFLKAKLLVIFEGEDVRIAVEDLNRLVSVHIQRCVQQRAPTVIVEDLRDLLQTGFLSLNHTIRTVPDDRLVPHLVQMWLFVFGTVLPFMQAVFLPLDLEFKGRGSIMSSREAKEFWGAALPTNNNEASTSTASASTSAPSETSTTAIGDELSVRRIVLVSFRDTVILPRYDILKATFSRLSLDSINASVAPLRANTPSSFGNVTNDGRPDTAASNNALDPGFASYNSQASTLLDSAGARSRATSNLSNTSGPPGDFQSVTSQPSNASSGQQAPADSSTQVTETVARMLQCVSVLASVQSNESGRADGGGGFATDPHQEKMEALSKELKHNWLGRGRTGRNRRGFVGTRVRRDVVAAPAVAAGAGEESASGEMSGVSTGFDKDVMRSLSML